MTALVVLFALSAGPALAGEALVQRSSKVGGFAVKLPSSWHYKNASYPSDHSTEFWTDPTDGKSKLEVQVSACVGCAEPPSCTLHNTGCRPAPEGLVPRGAISKRKLGPWSAQFVRRVAGNAYLDHGLIVIRHRGNEIVDWEYVELWLAPSQGKLATSILASFRLR